MAHRIPSLMDNPPSKLERSISRNIVFALENAISVTPERSGAIAFLLPKNLAQKCANGEITYQELIDNGQIVVNGVLIALHLRFVE
jgi:hypothetical protein